MKRSACDSRASAQWRHHHFWHLGALCMLFAAALVSGCASMQEENTNPVAIEKPFAGASAQPKNIFVFLDGTRNDARSGTNVRRMFEAVRDANDPQTTSIYIEGVGTTETPALGAGLGLGMEPRILRGYDFIGQSFRPGDRIFIIGFSRGAHQARALAGLLAYAGAPAASTSDLAARLRTDNKILEVVKAKNDADYLAKWNAWQSGSDALLAGEIKSRLNIVTVPVEITFLGVWDTVPGSAFKHFSRCKEEPDRREGDRYKSDSYPVMQNIFHAVALDEKRSRFSPLLLCPAIRKDRTAVHETWFAGAHADVGGGYDNAHDLSNLSLQWMTSALAAFYPPLAAARYPGDPMGVAHWSIGDTPGNALSHCIDRTPPPGADRDPSVQPRMTAGAAPLVVHGVSAPYPYPPACAQDKLPARGVAMRN